MGIGWMAFGVALYVYYRISEDKPVFKRVTVPEKTLTRPRQEAEYGSILVPYSASWRGRVSVFSGTVTRLKTGLSSEVR